MTKVEMAVKDMIKAVKDGNDLIDDHNNETIKRAARMGLIHTRLRFSVGFLVVTDKGNKFLKEAI